MPSMLLVSGAFRTCCENSFDQTYSSVITMDEPVYKMYPSPRSGPRMRDNTVKQPVAKMNKKR